MHSTGKGHTATERFLLKDKYYMECIGQALNSKGSFQKYGSIIVKRGAIIGKGHNRRITSGDAIRQGYANHAEISAINSAVSRRKNPEGSDMYVAGFFTVERTLCLRASGPNYTCLRCIPGMKEYGIGTLFVPTMDGWMPLQIDGIESVVRKFLESTKGKGLHEKRLKSWNNPYTIDFILKNTLKNT